MVMVFKKWQKPIRKKKVEEVKEVIIEDETPVSTVVEEEIIDDEIPAGTVFQDEEEIFVKKQKKSEWFVIGSIWDSPVVKAKGRIKFEAQVAPIPMFKLPADIRQYLINNGFTSDVYKKDKEWLEKHHADMKMIEKLKNFLTERL